MHRHWKWYLCMEPTQRHNNQKKNTEVITQKRITACFVLLVCWFPALLPFSFVDRPSLGQSVCLWMDGWTDRAMETCINRNFSWSQDAPGLLEEPHKRPQSVSSLRIDKHLRPPAHPHRNVNMYTHIYWTRHSQKILLLDLATIITG